jgi:hypothetical protein
MGIRSGIGVFITRAYKNVQKERRKTLSDFPPSPGLGLGISEGTKVPGI